MQNKSIILTSGSLFMTMLLSACAPQNVHEERIEPLPQAGSKRTGNTHKYRQAHNRYKGKVGNRAKVRKKVNVGKTTKIPTQTKTKALTRNGKYSPSDLENPSSILSKRVVYFAYDSSRIDKLYIPIIKAHASLLSNYPTLKVRLEGHADERGSREYNVALSENRAKNVQNLMNSNGTKQEQTQLIAFGEEHPIEKGHNEASWSKNRRVEIKYIGK